MFPLLRHWHWMLKNFLQLFMLQTSLWVHMYTYTNKKVCISICISLTCHLHSSSMPESPKAQVPFQVLKSDTVWRRYQRIAHTTQHYRTVWFGRQHLVKPLSPCGSPRTVLPKLCPEDFWISPRMETLSPLWPTSASAWSPSLWPGALDAHREASLPCWQYYV